MEKSWARKARYGISWNVYKACDTCASTGKRPVSITLLEEPHGLLKTTTQMNANVCGMWNL